MTTNSASALAKRLQPSPTARPTDSSVDRIIRFLEENRLVFERLDKFGLTVNAAGSSVKVQVVQHLEA